MRTRWRVWSGWVAAAGWMALIFAGSTDILSATHTARFLEPLLRWLFHGSLQPSKVDLGHHLIRKLGHLLEYAVLALLLWNAIRLTAVPSPGTVSRLSERYILGLALLLAGVYAAGDEFHQSFVPSRGASVGDVLIDVVGGMIGLLLLQAGRWIRRRWAAEPRRPDKS